MHESKEAAASCMSDMVSRHRQGWEPCKDAETQACTESDNANVVVSINANIHKRGPGWSANDGVSNVESRGHSIRSGSCTAL